MQSTLEKYDKLIVAILVIVASVIGVGYWFAEEKSEPVYKSKIDKLMFDKDNKAPKFILTLPDKLTPEKTKIDAFVDDVRETQVKKEIEENPDFSLEDLLAAVPNIFNLPAKNPTQQLKYISLDENLYEIDEKGVILPKIATDGRKPWSEYGNSVDTQPNFKKVAIVIAGMGFNQFSVTKVAEAFDSEVSVSFTPYTPKPETAILAAREKGHETYMDLLLSSRDFSKEDSGPLSITTDLTKDEAVARFHKTIATKAPIGGIVVDDGLVVPENSHIIKELLTETKQRGLLVIDASNEKIIDDLQVDGLARRKADIVISKDMVKHEVEELLQKAENIAFNKGQVLIVAAPKPVTILAIYNWINTFSPQISYEEAKKVEISKPFALVPVSNLVVE